MHRCYCCDRVLVKDDVALCKKILGRNIECFFCRAHLAETLKVDEELLTKKIAQFKAEGCTLFF